MKESQIKPNTRYYHIIFGWCKTSTLPVKNGKIAVDLEADEIEYYSIGKGYIKFKREADGRHWLITNIDDLIENEGSAWPKMGALKKQALNPHLTFWDKKLN